MSGHFLKHNWREEKILNPIAQIPRGEATPIKRFCFSKDFENEW